MVETSYVPCRSGRPSGVRGMPRFAGAAVRAVVELDGDCPCNGSTARYATATAATSTPRRADDRLRIVRRPPLAKVPRLLCPRHDRFGSRNARRSAPGVMPPVQRFLGFFGVCRPDQEHRPVNARVHAACVIRTDQRFDPDLVQDALSDL